jgi:cell division protein FtsN
MAREYGSRRSSRRAQSASHQLLVIVVTFLFGYFTASFFDINSLGQWMNKQIMEEHNVPNQQVTKENKQEIPPKPKFEFYTLLANDKKPENSTANKGIVAANTTAQSAPPKTLTTEHVASAAASVSGASTRVVLTKATPSVQVAKPAVVKVVEAKPVISHGVSKNYVVQVAAFKARREADQMKGMLTLKGFEVNVSQIRTPAKGDWYRVIIGPYPNKDLAQKAQAILAKTERLNGMVRSV